MHTDLTQKVFKVTSTRVWRTYFGGMEIERWQGIENPKDGDKPEEWVASAVLARNPGREHITDEGLSKIFVDGEGSITLRDAISGDPEGFLGEEHYEKIRKQHGFSY